MNGQEPFEENCIRARYNAEYDRLQRLIQDGLITPQEYCGQLNQLKLDYPQLFPRKDT